MLFCAGVVWVLYFFTLYRDADEVNGGLPDGAVSVQSMGGSVTLHTTPFHLVYCMIFK